MNSNRTHSHSVSGGTFGGTGAYNNFGNFDGISGPLNAAGITINAADIEHGHNFNTDSGSGLAGSAHPNMQPTLVCVYLLFAGA
jgi:hypothetical protein